MKTDSCKIYIDRLARGQSEKFDLLLEPDFLDLQEDDLSFKEPVLFKGLAYLAEESCILHFDASTKAEMPCSICNQKFSYPIEIKGDYCIRESAECRAAEWDFCSDLREAILLEVPTVVECHAGQCPERQEIKKYLKLDAPDTQKRVFEAETFQPFKDLTLKDS